MSTWENCRFCSSVWFWFCHDGWRLFVQFPLVYSPTSSSEKGGNFCSCNFFFKGRPLASFLLVLFSSSLFCFCIKPACCQAGGGEAVLCRCWGRQYLILTKMSQLRQPRANKHADSQALFWVCILSILPPTSAHLLPTGSLRGSCCWAHTFSKRMDGPDVVHTLRERITHS